MGGDFLISSHPFCKLTTLLPIALKSFSVFLGICALLFSVAYPDPGSDAFVYPGSRTRDLGSGMEKNPDPRSGMDKNPDPEYEIRNYHSRSELSNNYLG
jgi:hypothetical protein